MPLPDYRSAAAALPLPDPGLPDPGLPVPAVYVPGGPVPGGPGHAGAAPVSPLPGLPAGFAAAPVRRRGRYLVPVAAGVLLLGGGGVAYGVTDHGTIHRPAAEPRALVAAPTIEPHDLCLDKSGSVDRDALLATRAITTLQHAVTTRHAFPADPSAVPDWRASAAVPGLDLQVQVVRANSYQTLDLGSNTVAVSVPRVDGVAAEPEDPTADELAHWDTARTRVASEQVTASTAQRAAAAPLAGLRQMASNGSDVIGCVAAQLQLHQPEQRTDLLVVSDLEDTLPRSFTGDYRQTQLTILQACPSGQPAYCGRLLATFERRVARLGIPAAHVHVYRAEDVTTAIPAWLHG